MTCEVWWGLRTGRRGGGGPVRCGGASGQAMKGLGKGRLTTTKVLNFLDHNFIWTFVTILNVKEKDFYFWSK